MANRSMDVAERDGDVIFLRKLREGPAAKSYGLHVASLAGLSENVLRRAAELMASFSAQKQKSTPETVTSGGQPAGSPAGPGTGRHYDPGAKIIKELAGIETDAITPLEALNLIHRWKKFIQSTGKGRAERYETKHHSGIGKDMPSLFD